MCYLILTTQRFKYYVIKYVFFLVNDKNVSNCKKFEQVLQMCILYENCLNSMSQFVEIRNNRWKAFDAIINANAIHFNRTKDSWTIHGDFMIALEMCRNGPLETAFSIKITNSTNHQIYMKFDEVLHFQHHNTMFNNVHLCFCEQRTTNPLTHNHCRIE